MTSIYYNGKTLFADKRTTNSLTKETADLCDKLVNLTHLNLFKTVFIGSKKTKAKVVLVGGAGSGFIINQLVRFITRSATDIDLVFKEKLGYQIMNPRSGLVFLLDNGHCYEMVVEDHYIKLKRKEKPFVMGSGKSGFYLAEALIADKVKLTSTDIYHILSTIDPCTSPTFVEFNIKRNSLIQHNGLDEERKATLANHISNLFR